MVSGFILRVHFGRGRMSVEFVGPMLESLDASAHDVTE